MATKSTKIVLKRQLEINDNLKLHLYGTQLIVEAGLMLNLPQITISKAQIIFHRFYFDQHRDFIDFPPFHIAMTCTYLASKIDENIRRHRDILTVFDRIHKKKQIANSNSNQSHLRTIDPHGKVKFKFESFFPFSRTNISLHHSAIRNLEREFI